MGASEDLVRGPYPDSPERATAWATFTRRAAGIPRWFVPYLVLAGAFLTVAGTLAWAQHDKPELHLDATFSAKSCCQWQIWVNGLANPSNLTILPLYFGTRQTYSIPIYRKQIQQLDIPVGTQTGGYVVLHRIWISRGSHVIGSVTPDQLRHATTYHLDLRPSTGGGVDLIPNGVNPAIDLSDLALPSGEGSARLFLVRTVVTQLTTFPGLVLVAILALAVAGLRRRAWLLPPALVLTGAVIRGLPWLSNRLALRDDVTRAVGYASYVGVWKSRERFVLDATVLASAGIAGLFGLLALRRARGRPTVDGAAVAPAAARPPRLLAPLLVLIPIAVYALVGVPNLKLLIGPPGQLEPSWDANNLDFWQYLIQKTSLEPMKDFFWPYGFEWLFDKPAPWGPVASFLVFLSFWSFVALGTYLALARFLDGWTLVRRYLFAITFCLTAVLAGDAAFETRYVGPLGALLIFVGIGSRESWRSPKRLLFAVALFELTLFEIAQAIYVVVPVAFLLAVELGVVWRSRESRVSWAIRGVLTVLAPLLAAALCLTAVGVAHGNVLFYEQELFAWSAYAYPTAIDSWISHPSSLAGIVYWSVAATIGLGVFGMFARRRAQIEQSAVVVALGILGFMMMQKQVLRPGIEGQAWLPLVYGLVFWALTAHVFAAHRRAVVVAAATGAMGALILVSGGYASGWREISRGPDSLSASVGALIHDRTLFAADAKDQFDAETFVKFTDYQPVVAALRRDPQVRAGGNVWILGDDSPITMMLGHSWPYYFNDLYDTSALAFQKLVLNRLREHPPLRTVWNFSPAAMVFDQVPSPVRVPLLFGWAVTHLEPAQRVGHFEILRPRRDGERVALAWWRRRIGVTENFGHIPEVSTLTGVPCVVNSAGCATQLVVQFPESVPHPPEIDIPVTVGGLHFTVAFDTSTASRYVISLNRAWFWAANPAHASVDLDTVGGASVTVLHRTADGSILY